MRVSTRKPDIESFEPFARAVEECDGVEAFGEASRRDVREDRPARYLAVYDDELIALAVMGREGTELAVHPDHRRQGWGKELIGHVTEITDPRVWAHGNLPGAQRLAAIAGLEPGRELVQMIVHLGGVAPVESDLAFRQPRDGAEVVRLNAEIFADHPEQAGMAEADVEARGGRIMIGEVDGEPVGFAWIQEDPAELYVLGVLPRFQGRGYASALTSHALNELAGIAESATLFVDRANTAAVATYEKAGFTVHRTDVQYVARQ